MSTIAEPRISLAKIMKRGGKTEAKSRPATTRPLRLRLAPGVWAIQTQHQLQESVESVQCVAGDLKDIWPGSLVSLQDLDELTPLVVPRGPITLSLGGLETSPSAGEGLSEDVSNPTRSRVRNAVQRMVKRAVGTQTSFPARAFWDFTQVYNEDHMKLQMSAAIGFGGFGGRSSMDWSKTGRRTRILARYRQEYYTIDVDEMDLPEGFFPPAFDLDEVAAEIHPGSRPAYVSSVTYGMTAYTLIESDSEESRVYAALEASYRGVGAVDAKVEAEHRSVLQSSRMTTYVLGGSTKGLRGIMDGYDGFRTVLSASLGTEATSTPVPIAFRLTNLQDGSPASIAMAAKYSDAPVLPVRLSVKSITLTRSARHPVKLDRVFFTIEPKPEPVFSYWDRSFRPMHVGDVFACEAHEDVDIDAPSIDQVRLTVKGSARDWGRGAIEDYWAEGHETRWGADVLGEHTLELTHAKCAFDLTYAVEPRQPK